MILIGGASVLVNYGFRDMTTDIDAVIQAASVIAQIKIFFIPCNRSRKMLSIIVMALLRKEVIYG